MGFHTYAILNLIGILTGAYKTYYNYIPFDAEFYVDLEFIFEILTPPTHFEISLIFKFCVGGLKKILSHKIKNFILSRNIYILRIFYTCKNRFRTWVWNFQRRPEPDFSLKIFLVENGFHPTYTSKKGPFTFREGPYTFRK